MSERIRQLWASFISRLDELKVDRSAPIEIKMAEIKWKVLDTLAVIWVESRQFAPDINVSLKEQENQWIKALYEQWLLPFSSIEEALERIIRTLVVIHDDNAIELPVSIFQTPMVDRGIYPSENEDAREYELKTADKWQLFLKVLHHNGMTLPDNAVFKESLDDRKMRKIYYRIAYIEHPEQKTVCISDQIGEAIYIYDGLVPLTIIIAGMKHLEGYDFHKIEWKWALVDIAEKIRFALTTNIAEEKKKVLWKSFDGIPEEVYKREAQLELIRSSEVLAQLWIVQTENGGWDLRNLVAMSKTSGKDKKIGGKNLVSFPSWKWNKLKEIGNKKWVLENARDVLNMLISIGYSPDQIIKKPEDPLEWKDGMDEETYKMLARQFFEEAYTNGVLKKIGIVKTENGWWDLRRIVRIVKCLWDDKKIWGKNITNFPSASWNIKQSIVENGRLQNSDLIADMLESIGYPKEQILRKVKGEILPDEEVEQEVFMSKSRELFEAAFSKGELLPLGIKKDESGKWDLRDIVPPKNWSAKIKINHKSAKNFPTLEWNVDHTIGNSRWSISYPEDVVRMLLSIGYEKSQILLPVLTSLDRREAIDEEQYKEYARHMLETAEQEWYLKEMGIVRTPDGGWDLRDIRSKEQWGAKIEKEGMKSLLSFPSILWNKKQKIGYENGALQSVKALGDMLESIGYKKSQILLPPVKNLEWKKWMDEEAYKKSAREAFDEAEKQGILKKYGIAKNAEGKWDLMRLLPFAETIKIKELVGWRYITAFPSSTWNREKAVTYDGSGTLKNISDYPRMLLSIGYRQEDIISRPEDPLRWRPWIDEAIYTSLARSIFEAAGESGILARLWIIKTADGRWDMRWLIPIREWNKEDKKIWGKWLYAFPYAGWNKHKSVGRPQWTLGNLEHVYQMLVSIGYTQDQIIKK